MEELNRRFASIEYPDSFQSSEIHLLTALKMPNYQSVSSLFYRHAKVKVKKVVLLSLHHLEIHFSDDDAEDTGWMDRNSSSFLCVGMEYSMVSSINTEL